MNKKSELVNNITLYEKEIKKYVEKFGEDCDFLYRVATNYIVLNLEGIYYYEGEIKETLRQLVLNNPSSQLATLFKERVGFSLHQLLHKADPHINYIQTFSDAGGVKVGNDEFSIIIPNGYGDGDTNVYITELQDIPARHYFTLIEGKFNIYDYDCGSDVVFLLNGRYQIYYENGTVIFNKI